MNDASDDRPPEGAPENTEAPSKKRGWFGRRNDAGSKTPAEGDRASTEDTPKKRGWFGWRKDAGAGTPPGDTRESTEDTEDTADTVVSVVAADTADTPDTDEERRGFGFGEGEGEGEADQAGARMPPESVAESAELPAKPKGWFGRLRAGLSRSSAKLTEGITGIFQKRKLDDETLEELEELLITADLGPTTAAGLTASLASKRYGKDVTPAEVRGLLADEIAEILRPVAEPLSIDPACKPFVILVVGVNGSGKTTTIGKLAKQWRDEGRSVMLAAGDTFRAAAIGQLQVWGERAGVPVLAREQGSDAAALAYDAITMAKSQHADALLIDTAGRLQNKDNLMAELAKMVRVLKKQDETGPHAVLLVLDATTGQNAHAQVDAFCELVNVTGLVVTKLDGSARGGVLVALADKFGLPVHAVGVGEAIEDLRPFDPSQFARSLMGLEAQ